MIIDVNSSQCSNTINLIHITLCLTPSLSVTTLGIITSPEVGIPYILRLSLSKVTSSPYFSTFTSNQTLPVHFPAVSSFAVIVPLISFPAPLIAAKSSSLESNFTVADLASFRP